MLDSHPRLAVPPESHFVVALASRRLRLRHRPAATLEAVLAHPRFLAWGIDPDAVREFVRAAAPVSYADVMRAVFAAYADSQGKPRWGDKTPSYGRHVPFLAAVFPDARFVHVIRDGREAAASLAEEEWGPPTAVMGMYWWRKWVGKARASGRILGPGRYTEIRFERLLGDPEGVLRNLCDFLGEEFEPAMLGYHGVVADRMPPDLLQRHPNLRRPPTTGLRDWRNGLSPLRQRAVEAAGRRQLEQLGYGVGDGSLRALPVAWALRAEGACLTWPRTIAAWLHPATRSF